jgi:hypothetical protein
LNPQLETKECCKDYGVCGYVAALIGSFLIMAGLVWIMWHYTRPAPVAEDRAAVRRKALVELRAANADVLYSGRYVWRVDANVSAANHIVRMPIDRAMELTLKLWQNPAAARSNLTARVEKATSVPPPQVLE